MAFPVKLFLFWTLIVISVVKCTGTDIPSSDLGKCPNPDNTTDAAEDITSSVERPPSGISDLNVTGVDPYNINISWSTPLFDFDTPIICHFYLNVSFTPSQKGSHLRARHMNCHNDMRSITIATLTPSTNVTIKLSTCLLMPLQPNRLRRFVCTQPKVISHQTSPNQDKCQSGYYTHPSGQCTPCQCNNNSKLCEYKTGICLDCRNGSDGEHCEKCLLSYRLTANNICEHEGPSSGRASAGTINVTSSVPSKMETPLQLTSRGATKSSVERLTTASPGADGAVTSSNTTVPNADGTPAKTTNSLPIAIIVTSCLISLAIIICVVVIIVRKCGFCRKKPIQFWTIQLQSENSDHMTEGPLSTREDNRLIENDFTAQLNDQQFVSDENPYRPVTA